MVQIGTHMQALLQAGFLFYDGIYIPSRPPGFPLYEIIVGLFGLISVRVLLVFILFHHFYLPHLCIQKFKKIKIDFF